MCVIVLSAQYHRGKVNENREIQEISIDYCVAFELKELLLEEERCWKRNWRLLYSVTIVHNVDCSSGCCTWRWDWRMLTRHICTYYTYIQAKKKHVRNVTWLKAISSEFLIFTYKKITLYSYAEDFSIISSTNRKNLIIS